MAGLTTWNVFIKGRAVTLLLQAAEYGLHLAAIRGHDFALTGYMFPSSPTSHPSWRIRGLYAGL